MPTSEKTMTSAVQRQQMKGQATCKGALPPNPRDIWGPLMTRLVCSAVEAGTPMTAPDDATRARLGAGSFVSAARIHSDHVLRRL